METEHFLFWLPMMALAFINAALRELVFRKHFSELRAGQLSTIMLMILCGIYGILIFKLLRIDNRGQALLIGLVWVLLTVLFEFTLGKVLKQSWSQMLDQYNLQRGQLWPVFLIFLLLLPYVLYFTFG